VDPRGNAASITARQRRDLLKAVVQENVYVKAGKRPPGRRPRRWNRWLGVGIVVPGIAVGALLFLPEPRSRATVTPTSKLTTQGSSEGARPPAGPSPTRPGALADATANLLAREPRLLDSAVFPVGVHRIVLDPGHGGKDVGSVTADGQYEKDITLDIAMRLRALLREQPGVEVLLTRERDEQVVLRDRARLANESKADLFVSIHLNWLVPATNRGVETFFLGPTEDPFLVQLAGRENRESGYSLGDVRRLLDDIYLDLRQQESQQLAATVQRSLYKTLRQDTPALRDRGVKSAPFLVLVTTEMPAILAEVSCLSNESEAALLATGEYRQSIAEALRAGIQSYTTNLTHTNVPAARAATGSPT
jgi:N-acetylmuramoyl-L-alanine amidase